MSRLLRRLLPARWRARARRSLGLAAQRSLRELSGRKVEDLRRTGVLDLGRRSYFDTSVPPRVHLYPNDDNVVRVGAFTSIAADVEFMPGGNHRHDWVSTYPLLFTFGPPDAIYERPWSKGDIVIGNDVWIGQGAKFLSGVEVGNGAVIAAYAVVVHQVPPYAIAAGNPARVVGHRFAAAEIAALQRIAWWNWPDEEIRQHLDLFSGPVEAFIRRFDPLLCE